MKIPRNLKLTIVFIILMDILVSAIGVITLLSYHRLLGPKFHVPETLLLPVFIFVVFFLALSVSAIYSIALECEDKKDDDIERRNFDDMEIKEEDER